MASTRFTSRAETPSWYRRLNCNFNTPSYQFYSQWLGASLMWVGLHFLLWDGRVNTMEDLTASLQSPGIKVDLPSHAGLSVKTSKQEGKVEEQDPYFEFENVGLGSLPAGKDNTQLSQISLERLWNFLASPDSSTRNLYTNVLYVKYPRIVRAL